MIQKELAAANNTFKNLNATLKYAEEKAGQADKLVAELEKEIDSRKCKCIFIFVSCLTTTRLLVVVRQFFEHY
ncbi:hypothetical protein [Peribacillus sp. CSMR9]|uniref:hypothetical protein n=1 Tax=Peribacillus sp. CSMR9 TaxID=2981350 RepID=UPI002952DD89|nr:hypothetical protein [Peribacillus sp. CSMR9]MDV7767722.1 hypothetical protein [Peribacillus sp. CSMR9]